MVFLHHNPIYLNSILTGVMTHSTAYILPFHTKIHQQINITQILIHVIQTSPDSKHREMHTFREYIYSALLTIYKIFIVSRLNLKKKKSHPKQNNIHQQQHEQLHVVSTPATKQSMAAFVKETVKASLKNCDISVFI